MDADHLQRIRSMIVQDERYSGRDWSGITVVAIVDDESVDLTGFVYDAAGKVTPGNMESLKEDFRPEQPTFPLASRTHRPT